MALRNHKSVCFFYFFVFLFLLIKLFTAEVLFFDDPTSIFVLRLFPSLNNNITMLPHSDMSGYFILFSDENGFIGDGVYYFIVKYLWWGFPLIGLIYFLYKK